MLYIWAFIRVQIKDTDHRKNIIQLKLQSWQKREGRIADARQLIFKWFFPLCKYLSHRAVTKRFSKCSDAFPTIVRKYLSDRIICCNMKRLHFFVRKNNNLTCICKNGNTNAIKQSKYKQHMYWMSLHMCKLPYYQKSFPTIVWSLLNSLLLWLE